MRRHRVIEYLLSRTVGNAQAFSIVGDLIELSLNRRPVWFYWAAVQTLLRLMWRTPAALLMAAVTAGLGNRFLLNLCLWIWIRFQGGSLPMNWLLHHAYVGLPLVLIQSQLLILFPLVAVRYGVKDRLTQVCGFTLFAETLVLFATFSVPHDDLLLVIGCLGCVGFIGAMTREEWRFPILAQIAVVIAGSAISFPLFWLTHLLSWVVNGKPLDASSHYVWYETSFAFRGPLYLYVSWTICIVKVALLAHLCFFICDRWRNRTMDRTMA